MIKNKTTQTTSLSWDYHLPLFSSFIWKNIALGFGITALVMCGFAAALGGFAGVSLASQTPDIYFAAGFVGLIIIITLLVFIVIFFRGFDMKYKIDKYGVHQSVKGASAKVHRAAIILGLLARSTAAVGAGLTAQGGEHRSISWNETRKVRINTKKRYIHISRAFLGIYPIDMFCTKQNFATVLTLFKKHLPKRTIIYI